MLTLDELFAIASQYGNMKLFQHEDRTWAGWIEFRTIKHVQLKAESGHGHATPHAAVASMITQAKRIVGSMEETLNNLKQIKG